MVLLLFAPSDTRRASGFGWQAIAAAREATARHDDASVESHGKRKHR
jgi:hypothetical protein